MSEYIVKGAEPNETVLHTMTPNGYEEWRWLPVREEIVRCRDCTHFSEGMGTNVWLCERMEYLDLEGWTKNVRVDPNGFCAWGERRDA